MLQQAINIFGDRGIDEGAELRIVPTFIKGFLRWSWPFLSSPVRGAVRAGSAVATPGSTAIALAPMAIAIVVAVTTPPIREPALKNAFTLGSILGKI